MSYQQYGISSELVEKVKRKMKNPAAKERVKNILDGVTKQDLQNRATVRKLLGKISRALNEKLTEQQSNQIVDFVIAQQIDPNNKFHLIKLWAMFR
ncbi:stage VI sporulation protein F [Ferviditalea candida]|uniref:Stage VI sporulation protein F n=1 Tax=Ferviditalea candida TaxID=3108399 RepID=A0ABU5ZIS6_9BACL|nr:stage VI sporulation protein F [Paenibacillaceae bacterium T2]